ncbi:MAG: transglycosylase domain-containing protein, partial [Myxococcales bacterium]|nr:transglycosylase domain-containing protein [Myxococcales bacterium]
MAKKKADPGLDALDAAKKSASRSRSKATSAKDATAARPSRAKKAAGKPKVTARTAKGRKPAARKGKPAAPVSWRRWLLTEAVVWGLGAVAGLGVTGGLLWARAERDVQTYLATPPHRVPSVVWSAPMRIEPGMRASVQAIAGDLLAAGYERVDQVEPAEHEGADGLFAVRANGFDIWTAPSSGPGGKVPGGRAAVRIEEGFVTETSGRDGLTLRPTVLGTIGDLDDRRTPVTLDKLSRWVEPALLSMEDTRFRQHHGVDPIGVGRALVGNLMGRDVQGGSTLTQQLAKNLFLSREKTLRRKVREVFFAAALEHELDKDQLLELYLSEVYLGQMGGLPIYGVDQAARAWFGVSASSLELHEAATVVGAIPAPNSWSPVRNPEASLQRRNLVLAKMKERGVIDEDHYQNAVARALELQGLEPSKVRRAPYAVDAAVDRAETALGDGALANGGWGVYTAIQPLLQRAAEEAVQAGMEELDTDYPDAAGAQVALVAVRVSDGAVVALVGGRSYAGSPFDRARDAHRQAGSTVKPLTMIKAFEDGAATPATKLLDAPITRRIDGTTWTPHDSDGRWLGEITVRKTIEASRNIPAILLAEQVGAARLQRFYREAGLSEATHLPSAALGSFLVTPIELAGAYTVFHHGEAYEPRVLTAITRADGEPVLTLPAVGHRLASEQAAAQAMSVLQGVLAAGTGARAGRFGVGPPAGGKTGTTDDYRDAWFAGLSGDLAIVVWV